MKKWELFTKEELEDFVKNSISINEVGKKCGYANNSGSGAIAIKEMIKFYNFDTSHFAELNGVPHNKGQHDYSRFKDNHYLKPCHMKSTLEDLRGGHKCENCKNETWQGHPIPLEVHHIDGNNMNNTLENLILLCPNCHALTDNYRTRNKKPEEKREEILEKDFKEALEQSPNIRQALLKLGLAPKGGNYTRANEIIAKYNIQMIKNNLLRDG